MNTPSLITAGSPATVDDPAWGQMDDITDITEVSSEATRERPPRWRRTRAVGRAIASASEWVFGALALVIGLSVLASIPIAQFLCLGYLLESEGRVARSGRFRDAFVGVRRTARAGSIILGAWLLILPLRLVSSLATSAELIDPGGPIARNWRVALIVLSVLTVLHIGIACAEGAGCAISSGRSATFAGSAGAGGRAGFMPGPVMPSGISSSPCGCPITSAWGSWGSSARWPGW